MFVIYSKKGTQPMLNTSVPTWVLKEPQPGGMNLGASCLVDYQHTMHSKTVPHPLHREQPITSQTTMFWKYSSF